jgi:hypothetical protein
MKGVLILSKMVTLSYTADVEILSLFYINPAVFCRDRICQARQAICISLTAISCCLVVGAPGGRAWWAPSAHAVSRVVAMRLDDGA